MRSTATTRSVAQLFGAFALVALGTALVMATDLLLPNVTESGLQQNAVRLAVLAVLLCGAWLALSRAQFGGRARLTAWLAIAVPLLVWQSVVWWLALAGAFQGLPGPNSPRSAADRSPHSLELQHHRPDARRNAAVLARRPAGLSRFRQRLF